MFLLGLTEFPLLLAETLNDKDNAEPEPEPQQEGLFMLSLVGGTRVVANTRDAISSTTIMLFVEESCDRIVLNIFDSIVDIYLSV